VPSGTAGELYRYLKQSPNSLPRLRAKWESAREREVLIVPAFERLRTNLHDDPSKSPCSRENPTCWVYEKMDVPYTKAALVKMVKQRNIESFYMTRVRPCRRAGPGFVWPRLHSGRRPQQALCVRVISAAAVQRLAPAPQILLSRQLHAGLTASQPCTATFTPTLPPLAPNPSSLSTSRRTAATWPTRSG